MNILVFLNTPRTIYYSLHEINFKVSGIVEKSIDISEKVCDILSIWDSEFKTDLKKEKEKLNSDST